MIDGRRSEQSVTRCVFAVSFFTWAAAGSPALGDRAGGQGGNLLPPPALPVEGLWAGASFLFYRRAQALAWGSV